jgi:protein-tyrosine phosphatase
VQLPVAGAAAELPQRQRAAAAGAARCFNLCAALTKGSDLAGFFGNGTGMMLAVSGGLPIAELTVPGVAGVLGIAACPGRDGDLDHDVAAIAVWGAAVVVTLIERHELDRLRVAHLPRAVTQAGMRSVHLPIRELGIPDSRFEAAWASAGRELRASLGAGQRVLLHCRGGLGRAGTVAARLLIESGMAVEAAVAAVRRVRPGAIESAEEIAYLRGCRPPQPA